jgi:uncharacterized protein (DUF1697 family)
VAPILKTYIALFRGINVGGKNILPMKELILLLQNFGFENIKTYIQSGNVVFRSNKKDEPPLSRQISKKIKEIYRSEPIIHILGLQELENAISKNPFPESESKPESLHLGFLAAEPKNPDFIKLEALKKNSERYRLIDKIFYLNAPEGIGRSKLAANSERLLGVPMTDRNWRTVCKIRDIAEEIDE